ncbi:hypothetical protein SISSUDRAFT_1029903 [Sistotremastrum suecicum HHB10207 ss-3]|uniref:Uncharacterized protein n=1 Tax=Sistotremastrum suecicum HHB10207 ss-3 TaxID=1314776 RepID=A0A166I4E9_9AGAM|nr:hypothetical protein SISSUDRAFT_1029903 [Sistotremastrum suecicum HHB10207 ss-3]
MAADEGADVDRTDMKSLASLGRFLILEWLLSGVGVWLRGGRRGAASRMLDCDLDRFLPDRDGDSRFSALVDLDNGDGLVAAADAAVWDSMLDTAVIMNDDAGAKASPHPKFTISSDIVSLIQLKYMLSWSSPDANY